MRYRELLKLYEKKALSEQEMEKVAKDIERQDAISEYLFEKDGGAFDELGGVAGERTGANVFQQEDAIHFTRQVNQLIRRAFIKMGTVVGAVVLAILLFVLFALPQIVSWFYYDPMKIVAGTTEQFALDLHAYTELAVPGRIRDFTAVRDRGYGNYDITIWGQWSLGGRAEDVVGEINKGNLRLYEPNLLDRPYINVFAWYHVDGEEGDSLRRLAGSWKTLEYVWQNCEYATKQLKELNDSEMYLAYITLDEMMPYEEFMEYVKEKEFPISWCAVRTEETKTTEEEERSYWTSNLGFACDTSRGYNMSWDKEKYPNLVVWEANEYEECDWETQEEQLGDEDFMKEHFISMLRYLSDQKAFLDMVEGNGTTRGREFREAADYVEENGLMIYGCVAIADKETILKMNEDRAVYAIYTEPAP